MGHLSILARMKWPLTLKGWMRAIVQPEASSDVQLAIEANRQRVPVLWMLGKTGAGKSSIVERLTGDERAVIGNGFEPCTATASFYDHPAESPVMRFLDTRGLGEARYDPTEDLSFCSSSSHALLLVTRIDEPEQSAVIAAIDSLGSATDGLVMLHVITALRSIEDPIQRQRAIEFNSRQIRDAVGRTIPVVQIDFREPDEGYDESALGFEQLFSCTAVRSWATPAPPLRLTCCPQLASLVFQAFKAKCFTALPCAMDLTGTRASSMNF